MRHLIFIILLGITRVCFAQDSLKVFLKNIERSNDTIYIQQCCKIGEEYSNLKNINLAFAYMDSAIIRAQTVKDVRWIGYVYNLKANLCNYIGSQHDAFDYFDRALKLYRKSGYVDGEINVFVNRGNMYYGNGEFKRAQISYRTAEKLYPKSRKDELVLANIYNNLGGVYGAQEEYPIAEIFFNKALTIYLIKKDSLSCGYIYNNLGNIEQAKGNLKESLKLFLRALELKVIYGTNQEIAVAYRNLSEAYIQLDQHNEALACMEQSRKRTDTTLMNSHLILVYKQFARIHEKLNDYRQANIYYKKLESVNNKVSEKEAEDQSNQRDMLAEFTKVHLADSITQANKIFIQNSEIRRSTTVKYSLTILVVFTLIFIVILFKRFRQSQAQKKEIQIQKNHVDEKQKEILDSMNYAKNIQDALLSEDDFSKQLKDYFVFFKPKDIVSGDFYWTYHSTIKDDLLFIAVCDSTGHGVPGAFMSILNSGFLNEAISEKQIFSPDKVFDYVRQRLTDVIKNESQKDGFDGILVCFNKTDKTITYSAANNHPFIVRQNELMNLPYDKMPVGKGARAENFNLYNIDWVEGDTLYLITDGYADQFGGPDGKKLKSKNLKINLLSNSGESMTNQRKELDIFFEGWKGTLEQIDDVTVVGIKL